MLEVLGLSPDSIVVYEALVREPDAAADDLVGLTALPSSSVRKALSELLEKGLVARVVGSEERFAASPPEASLEALVLRRQESLARVRAYAAELASRQRAARERDDVASLVQIIVGAEAITRQFEQMQRAAQHEVLLFDRPPYPSTEGAVNDLEVQRLSEGIRYRVAYEASLLDDPSHVRRVHSYVTAGEEARLGDVPLKMAIVDDAGGLLLLAFEDNEREPAAVLVQPSVLLDSLKVLFETVWRQCAPFRVDLADVDGLTREEAQLMNLLMAGMKDEAIANQLDVSVRTVRRRLRALLDRLGVQTRFQAGVEAHRRGWV